MGGKQFSSRYGCSGRVLLVTLFAFFVSGLTVGAGAQHINIEIPHLVPVSPILPPTTLSPSLTKPSLAPTMTPSLPPPVTIQPTLAPPVTMPAPAPPSASPVQPLRLVRFRCEVAPQEESCLGHTEAPDGGGDDSLCDCSKDYCYADPDPTTGLMRRLCQKLQ